MSTTALHPVGPTEECVRSDIQAVQNREPPKVRCADYLRTLDVDCLNRAREIASAAGWQLVDLLNCPNFKDLQRIQTMDLSTITDEGMFGTNIKAKCADEVSADYQNIVGRVTSEMAEILAHRQRRKEAAAAEERRDAIAHLYEQLKPTIPKTEPMPHLAEFRKLPVVRGMQEKGTSSNAGKEIKQSNLVADLARGDLTGWQKEAQASLRKVLGHPERQQESPQSLDPLRRLTARFRCRNCDEKVKGRLCSSGMDFTEACSHRCENLSPRAKAHYVWKAERFIPDQKVSDAFTH